jgi:hypothetical protein
MTARMTHLKQGHPESGLISGRRGSKTEQGVRKAEVDPWQRSKGH